MEPEKRIRFARGASAGASAVAGGRQSGETLPGAGREALTGAGLLRDHGPAAGEAGDTPIAEPSGLVPPAVFTRGREPDPEDIVAQRPQVARILQEPGPVAAAVLIVDQPAAAKHDTHAEPALPLGDEHLMASTSSLATVVEPVDGAAHAILPHRTIRVRPPQCTPAGLSSEHVIQ